MKSLEDSQFINSFLLDKSIREESDDLDNEKEEVHVLEMIPNILKEDELSWTTVSATTEESHKSKCIQLQDKMVEGNNPGAPIGLTSTLNSTIEKKYIEARTKLDERNELLLNKLDEVLNKVFPEGQQAISQTIKSSEEEIHDTSEIVNIHFEPFEVP